MLLDWKMEGMSGLELIQQLEREAGRNHHKPASTVVMVTAYGREQLMQEAERQGTPINAVITKPVIASRLFDILLKVHRPFIETPRATAEKKVSTFELAEPIRGARILLVEDNNLNQLVATAFLQKAGLSPVVAHNGAEAVQWVLKEPFDAVLMDLQMPVMDGFAATRAIRALPEGRSLPIIAMTAAAMQHDRDASLAAGMDDHISKPISPNDLIPTLLRWIRPRMDENAAPPETSPQKSWADIAAALPTFEIDALMEALDGDRSQFEEILHIFLREFSEVERELAARLADGANEAAGKLVHKLAGTAGNIGAIALHRLSRTLDEQLKLGSHDPATLNSWRETLNRTRSDAARWLAQSAPQEPHSAAGTELFRQTVAELDERLAQNDFIEDELLARIRAGLPSGAQERYGELATQIRSIDYVKARTTLKRLAEMPDAEA